jgi:hypothetical protein
MLAVIERHNAALRNGRKESLRDGNASLVTCLASLVPSLTGRTQDGARWIFDTFARLLR